MSTGPAAYLKKLTIADFVADGFDPPVGGIFAGVGSRFARSDQEGRVQARALGQVPESFARARLVTIAPGKVLVRWCNSRFLTNFAGAASGLWWSSDDVADRIIRETLRQFGPTGDSGQVARVVSAVHHAWSDLGAVVVVRTEVEVPLMVGFGRPVTTTLPDTGLAAVLGDGKDLQFMMKTRDGNNDFQGHAFLRQLYLGSSTAFTRWWLDHNPAAHRRAATIAAAKAGLIVGGGYPKNVIRTS